jgi:hypothetical protein
LGHREQHRLQVGRQPGGWTGAQRSQEATFLVGGVLAYQTDRQVLVERMQHSRVEPAVDVRADLHPQVM